MPRFTDIHGKLVEGIPFQALGQSTFLRLTVGQLFELATATKRDPNRVLGLDRLIVVAANADGTPQTGDDGGVLYTVGDASFVRDLLLFALRSGNDSVTYSDVDEIMEELRGTRTGWLVWLATQLWESYNLGAFKTDPNPPAEA